MNQSEEHGLIRAAQGGDARAFEQLIAMHYETIFKMAFKWRPIRADAEDIAQEACIKLARGLDSFRFDSAFTSWLYRLVINTAKDWVKKNIKQTSSEGLEQIPVSAKAEDAVYAKEALSEIYKLPEGEREALILVFNDGLSHKETADILGVKESTISWRIHEARKKLGAVLGKERKYG